MQGLEQMSTKKEIDWERLHRKPETREEAQQEMQQKQRLLPTLDWSLLTQVSPKQGDDHTLFDSGSGKETKEQDIDWSMLTKSPKR